MSNATKGTGISTAVGAVTPLPTVVNEERGLISDNIHPPNANGEGVGQPEGFFTPENIHPPNGGDGP
jgi:hypothetical protein